MTRWLAGVFNHRGDTRSTRIAGALAPHVSTTYSDGPLQVAYSGPQSKTGGILCLLDGFLDNAAELTSILDVPTGLTDEALLACGWQRWGPGLPSRMRGDFALLIWEHARGRGLLARDQLGVRSVFLHETSDRLSFASEVCHLLALLPRRPSPDPASLAHWLSMSNRPGSATLFSGVRRLDPGSMLLLDKDGVHEASYWAPRFVDPLGETEPQLAEEFRAALGNAVGRRITSDAPTGILMSGGLDSAAVAAVAAQQAPGRVRAYSGVFPDHPAVDESALIDELARTLNLSGVVAEVRTGGLLASAAESAREWQLPLLGWGDFWTTPLLRAAAEAGVTVMLGGDGGDELFGVRAYLLADRLRAGHPFDAVRLAGEMPGAGDRPARQVVARLVGELAILGAIPYRLHELGRRLSFDRGSDSWLRRDARRALRGSEDPFAWKRLDGPRWWADVAHGLTRGIEETGVFGHQRRRAASAGLDARHPLFDLDLVELCLRQPPLATFNRYRNRPVLRAAVSELLPGSVVRRAQKASFNSLLVDSMAGADGAVIRRMLCDPQAELGAYVDPRGVERALFATDRTRVDQPFQWMWQVWRLLTAECWLRAQRDGGSISEPEADASAVCVGLRPRPGTAAART